MLILSCDGLAGFRCIVEKFVVMQFRVLERRGFGTCLPVDGFLERFGDFDGRRSESVIFLRKNPLDSLIVCGKQCLPPAERWRLSTFAVNGKDWGHFTCSPELMNSTNKLLQYIAYEWVLESENFSSFLSGKPNETRKLINVAGLRSELIKCTPAIHH
ncbi:hypothetical protein M758_6G055800 [Ceratodon purpureus]|nr:hypothetical protein M758_6G055800 [Ceratodon purpureus]